MHAFIQPYPFPCAVHACSRTAWGLNLRRIQTGSCRVASRHTYHQDMPSRSCASGRCAGQVVPHIMSEMRAEARRQPLRLLRPRACRSLLSCSTRSTHSTRSTRSTQSTRSSRVRRRVDIEADGGTVQRAEADGSPPRCGVRACLTRMQRCTPVGVVEAVISDVISDDSSVTLSDYCVLWGS